MANTLGKFRNGTETDKQAWAEKPVNVFVDGRPASSQHALDQIGPIGF